MQRVAVVKRIDKCGRVSIPKGIREALMIQVGDKVSIVSTEDSIQIKKITYNNDAECVFCGVETDCKFRDVSVCQDCVEEMYATV